MKIQSSFQQSLRSLWQLFPIVFVALALCCPPAEAKKTGGGITPTPVPNPTGGQTPKFKPQGGKTPGHGGRTTSSPGAGGPARPGGPANGPGQGRTTKPVSPNGGTGPVNPAPGGGFPSGGAQGGTLKSGGDEKFNPDSEAKDSTSTITVVDSTSVEVGGHTIRFRITKRNADAAETPTGSIEVTLDAADAAGGYLSSDDAGVVFNGNQNCTLVEGFASAEISYHSGTFAAANVATLNARVSGEHIQGSPISISQTAAAADEERSELVALDGNSVVVSAGVHSLRFEVRKRDTYNNPTALGSFAVSLNNIDAGADASVSSNDNGSTIDIKYYSGLSEGSDVAAINVLLDSKHISGSPGFIDQIPPPPTAVNVKVLLEGPYNGRRFAPFMHTHLADSGLVPLTDPYDGNESVSSVPGGIVDWVQLEFRTSSAGTAQASKAALLRDDGMVVAGDGSSQVTLPHSSLEPGQYYIVIRHRNHLAIMSRGTVTLSSNSSSLYDFSSAQNKAWTQTQNPMNFLATGIYGMVGGDAVNDDHLNASDRAEVDNAMGKKGYRPPDVDLDSVVRQADSELAEANVFRCSQVP